MEVIILDGLSPENNAMLQALYSRSCDSVLVNAERARDEQDFMKKFYIGYGHSSIGDCGTVTLFFEDVSILCAKAIQDNPLYSGQETSTRYIDMTKRRIHSPEESVSLLEAWRDLYVQVRDELTEKYSQMYPDADEKAIKCKVFDVARGFLPAGITTQLSWTTNLRQADEMLKELTNHPLQEVREVAYKALIALTEKYPSSFSSVLSPRWLGECELAYSRYSWDKSFRCFTNVFDMEAMEEDCAGILTNRPRGARVPRWMNRYGTWTSQIVMDYGSFRDLQRHRNGVCRLPLLAWGDWGFNEWYLRDLGWEYSGRVEELLNRANRLKMSEEDRQYFLPLGLNVCVETVYGLSQMVYVSELRSRVGVHPTLRDVAIRMGKALPDWVKVQLDEREDGLDLTRAEKDIYEI